VGVEVTVVVVVVVVAMFYKLMRDDGLCMLWEMSGRVVKGTFHAVTELKGCKGKG